MAKFTKKLPEEINEFSMKLQKSTQDMVDALLKVKKSNAKRNRKCINYDGKGYGLDYVKRSQKRRKRILQKFKTNGSSISRI